MTALFFVLAATLAATGDPQTEEQEKKQQERLKLVDQVLAFRCSSQELADRYIEEKKYPEAVAILTKSLKLVIPPEVLEEYREKPADLQELLFRPMLSLCQVYEKMEKWEELVKLAEAYRERVTDPCLRKDLRGALIAAYNALGRKEKADHLLLEGVKESERGLKFSE